MRCNWCGQGVGRNASRDKTGRIYYYYCSKCIGTINGEIGIEGKKLIAKFLERLDYLRDFVLEAPILTKDILEIKEYIHTIKDEIKKELMKWQKKLQEGEAGE